MSYSVDSAATKEQKSIINYFNRIKPVREDINKQIDKRNADNNINFKNLLIEQYTVLNNLLTDEISYYNFGDNSYAEAVKGFNYLSIK